MLRFCLGLMLWLGGSAVWAACEGRDLRPTLDASEEARLAQALAEAPFATGNHWRATRAGHVLHLVGTVHLDDPRLAPVMAGLVPLIQSAEQVLLEMTEAEQMQLQAAMVDRPELMLLQEGSLPDLLPEDDWARLSQAVQARGLPPFMAARFQPWYLSLVLAMPPCLAAQLAQAQGLDKQIEEAARAAQVPVAALEPFDTGFKAFADLGLDWQLQMLVSSVLPDAVSEDLFATLLAAYFEEAHAESWAVSQILSLRFAGAQAEAQDGAQAGAKTEQSAQQDRAQAEAIFAEIEARLLVARNHAWIPVLEGAATDQGPVLAAFGAGHLGGPDGVLALLAARGWKLERQPF